MGIEVRDSNNVGWMLLRRIVEVGGLFVKKL